MASTSYLAINQEPEVAQPKIIFKKEKNYQFAIRQYCCFPFALASLVFLTVYFTYNNEYCVLYINGTRNATFEKVVNCSSVELKYMNQTDHEVREEIDNPRLKGFMIAFIVCLVVAFLVLIPCRADNYVSCCRRTTCCCRPVNLKDAINRYMFGYISDEEQFQQVVQSGQENLEIIIQSLKNYIPEVTFDVLKAGSLVERLGKPTVMKLGTINHLSMKSVLSTDFDVMLIPQTILAAATEEPQISETLFNVVTLQNITPGFVWLKLNKDYQESRNMYWRNLCNEFTFPDGSKGIYLSSFEVRNVFVKVMNKIKSKEKEYFETFRELVEQGFTIDVKPQGPAVTIQVECKDNYWPRCIKSCRSTLFYGDFIFAIRCIGWPQEAREWPLRIHQRSWPPPAVVQEIMANGYHVVPKPSSPILDNKKKKKKKKKKQQSENESILEHEWRLSYSLAELLLSRHIPDVARACILALKATIKRHQKTSADGLGSFLPKVITKRHQGPGAGGLSSYHLKTVLYWTLETNSPDFWDEERIEECFLKLVDDLLDCVKNKHCSHYFMPQVNIMGCITPQLGKIGLLLTKIKANPASYVSSTNLRCMGNLAACYECMCFSHGEDIYMDVY